MSDGRSDIFSFGAVLYEMLTGKRAFKRDTAAETMTAILKEEPPDLMETGWQGPVGLQRILSRCLEKSVERRFQSASDLAFAIEALSGTGTSGIFRRCGGGGGSARRSGEAVVAAGALAMFGGGSGDCVELRPGTEPVPTFQRVSFRRRNDDSRGFAPDGKRWCIAEC